MEDIKWRDLSYVAVITEILVLVADLEVGSLKSHGGLDQTFLNNPACAPSRALSEHVAFRDDHQRHDELPDAVASPSSTSDMSSTVQEMSHSYTRCPIEGCPANKERHFKGKTQKSRRDAWKRHMGVKHEGNTLYHCNACPEKYPWKSSLVRHVGDKHMPATLSSAATGETP